MADSAIPEWRVQGELALNCNCKVFCPCVVSLGEHPPTDGRCFAWSAVHIDTGHWADTALDGLNIAWMLDIPGRMSEGGWSAALYVDDQASDEQAAGLEQIFSGAAQGTTGLLSLVVAEFLGSKKCPLPMSVTVKPGRSPFRKLSTPK